MTKKIFLSIVLLVFTVGPAESLWAACQTDVATNILEPGRVWQCNKRDLSEATTSTGTLEFKPGASSCAGNVTQSLESNGEGFLIESGAGQGAANEAYHVSFTIDSQDPTGRSKSSSMVNVRDTANASNLVVMVGKNGGGGMQVINDGSSFVIVCN